jgi:hypothetical protein
VLVKNISIADDFSIWESKVEGPLLQPTGTSGEKLDDWVLSDEHICFRRYVVLIF